MLVKIRKGTESEAEPDLCSSCRKSTIAHGPRGEIRHCCEMNRIIPFRVTACNSWDDKAKTSLGDLYRTAWILSSESSKKPMGFLPYSKWKEIHLTDEGAYY